MNRLSENNDAGEVDSDPEDPEQLLNEWLGELNNLTGVSTISILYHMVICVLLLCFYQYHTNKMQYVL